MEHILQFAVSIDEQAIIDRAEHAAAKSITAQVKEKIDEICRERYGSSQLSNMFKKEIAKVVEENKDEIIKMASEQLMQNMAKTKAVKEAVKKAAGDFQNEV